MTRKIVLALALMLAGATSAQAHVIKGDHWQRVRATAHVNTPSICPADGADRVFTIVNNGVTGVTLTQIAAIERATRDESFALRLYYGSPCAFFGPGGTPIYLSNGYQARSGGGFTYQMGGVHYATAIYVQTGMLPYTNWVRAFSHEVVESLVNPNDDRLFGNYQAEVCDPVENLTYEVDQLQVSDFATPAWFSGSPVGPWDAARRLTGPA